MDSWMAGAFATAAEIANFNVWLSFHYDKFPADKKLALRKARDRLEALLSASQLRFGKDISFCFAKAWVDVLTHEEIMEMQIAESQQFRIKRSKLE
jgi:hypothetical protein